MGGPRSVFIKNLKIFVVMDVVESRFVLTGGEKFIVRNVAEPRFVFILERGIHVKNVTAPLFVFIPNRNRAVGNVTAPLFVFILYIKLHVKLVLQILTGFVTLVNYFWLGNQRSICVVIVILLQNFVKKLKR